MLYFVKSHEVSPKWSAVGKFFQNLALILAAIVALALILAQDKHPVIPNYLLVGGVAQKFAFASFSMLALVFACKSIVFAITHREAAAMEVVNREVHFTDKTAADEQVKQQLRSLAEDIKSIDGLHNWSLGKKNAAKRRLRQLHDAAKTLYILPAEEKWDVYFKS